MGIHYDYKSTRGMRAMEKQAKREKNLLKKELKEKLKKVKKRERPIIGLMFKNPLLLIL